jgi:outer membrane protein OmpA-like peptidoglycan-associated protein
MPGGFGGTDIYRITRDNAGMWGAPENLGNIINTEGNEMFPFIHEDGLFFFASDGHPGLGGLDVFVTQLSNGKFAPTQNLGMPINSSHDDFSFIMNRQKTSGYFSSNRGGGKGNDDIYSYHILKPFLFGKQIKGTAKDKDGNVLANTRIELLDENNQPKFVVITKEDGSYVFDVEESKTYYLTGTKEKYFDGKNTVNTNDNNNILIVDLILEKDPGFSLMAKITDYKTGASLDNVKIKITDENGNKTEFVTPADGIYLSPITGKKLNDNLFYKIELSKQGYVSKTLEFRKKLEKPGIVDLTESLDLSLGKIELGTDVGKLVSINPIYFDVNKSNIRPDAAIELDKIVKIMNEYPVMVLELGSHTDCRSPKAYNLSLSDKRAKASAAYIVSKGIKKDRIYGKGYGESKLKNKCACEGPQPSPCTEEEHQQNRRTEFIIVKLNN